MLGSAPPFPRLVMSEHDTPSVAAAGTVEGDAPASPTTSDAGNLPVEKNPAPTSAASSDASAADGSAPADAGAAAPAEGGAGEGGPAGEGGAAAAATGEGGAPKKRRRRRRKKKPGAGAAGPGAPGTEGAEAKDGEAAEGEDAEGDEEGGEAEGGAEGEAKDGEAKDGEAKDGEGKKKRRRGKKEHHGREKAPFGTGEEVAARVTAILPDAIMLDVAGKALGIFDRKEIPESETPQVGETIIGKVVNDGARGGLVVLTRDLNRWLGALETVKAAQEAKQPVDGLVTGVIRGGIEIDVDGLRGFAPASHVDLRLGADLHHMIGQRLAFDVVQFEKRGREFVLSRKGLLDAEAKEQRAKLLETVQVGTVVKGIVRSIQPFGVFIDVGGVDGLCPIADSSHIVGKPLREIFKVGEETEVKILRIDERGKVWLSKKAVEKDPWDGATERYPRGSRHKGKVVRLQPFGAFIELEPGLDGLLHISDINAPRRLNHPSEVLKVGEELDVVIAQANYEAHKLGLHEAPKEGETYHPPPGSHVGHNPGRLNSHQAVKVIVEGHEPNGLVVRILGQTGRFAKGFIPAAATGTAKGTDLRRQFPVGTELDAKVVELDPRGGAKLSIKALQSDQERASFRQYQNEVKQAAKFGTFGDLLKNKGLTK